MVRMFKLLEVYLKELKLRDTKSKEAADRVAEVTESGAEGGAEGVEVSAEG